METSDGKQAEKGLKRPKRSKNEAKNARQLFGTRRIRRFESCHLDQNRRYRDLIILIPAHFLIHRCFFRGYFCFYFSDHFGEQFFTFFARASVDVVCFSLSVSFSFFRLSGKARAPFQKSLP